MGVDSLRAFLGESDGMAHVLDLALRAADVDVPVLLVGETGTGKSHLARLIHESGPRARGAFLAVNCAGIPEGLFESEFFGHKRGAFTGAVEARVGLFEMASGGTLFLDEVGDLPLAQQAKLLSVLEERRVRPVGGSQARAVDTRVIAASCRDPAAGVRAGTFRADLYHRLALLRCELPPLRSRPHDLQALIAHFLRQLRARYRRPVLALTPEAERLLLSHSWPGNVRELAHALEAAVILSGDALLSPEPFARVLVEVAGAATSSPPARDAEPGRAGTPERYSFFGSERDEREAIRRALVRCKGNRTRAARELGMARNTLRQKIRRLRLEPGPSHDGAETFPAREA